MNSMKLFNINYFKENLRKSKSVLAFFFGVIPLLNVLLLVISIINRNNNIEVIDFSAISTITYIGMYILPFVLSVSLFGFVFKRKSVDFVMSKPLSRKTIYFTNIFGGLIVLSIFILLNTIIYLLFSLFAPLVLPISLVIDYMLFWLVSYIFMFIVSTLGISISGNLISSIVIMFIIICFFPFLNITSTVFNAMKSNDYIKYNDNLEASIYCQTTDCEKHLDNHEYYLEYNKLPNSNNVAPLLFLNNEGMNYNLSSIIKMLILSLIYIIIGFYTFTHRKMENNEISFRNELVHYVVKTITIFPICLITYFLISEVGLTGLLISITLILIYSIIYDLITRKEIYKFLKSSLISLIVFGIFSGGYALYYNFQKTQVIDIDNINKISVYSSKYDDVVDIINKDLINKIIRSSLTQDGVSYMHMYIYVDNNKYELYSDISSELETEINKLLKLKKESELKKLTNKDILYTDKILIDKKLQDLIIKTVSDTKFNYDTEDSLIKFLIYDEHKFKEYNISKNTNQELDNYVLEKYSKEAVDFIKNEKNRTINFVYSGSNFDDFEKEVFNYVINENIDSFIKYLKNNNKEYKTNSSYIAMYGANVMYIPIGDVDSFKKEFQSYQEKLKSDETYLELLKNYEKELKEKNEY